MELVAYSKNELIEALSKADISVPPRGAERTNDHVERWSMYRTLATIVEVEGVEYPVFLEKRERPDYALVCNNVKFGCEVTTAINPDYLRASSLPQASDEDAIVDSSLFKWGTPSRNLEELRDIASRKKLSGSPWAGSSVEREYAKIVSDVTLNKTVKMRKKGYKTHPLVINRPPLTF